MKLTYNFTLEELIYSATAKRLKIDNTPTEDVMKNLLVLAELLQKIRDAFGKPIIVSSGYRSEKLNKAVGGASTSQHVKGQAADIRTVSDEPTKNKILFNMIKKMVDDGEIEVGQLIDEYNYNWIHISTQDNKHKNEILHIQ